MNNQEKELKLHIEKWARFFYELWQEEKLKKIKDHKIDEQKAENNR